MRNPKLADVLHEALKGQIATVHTSIPGIVERYDSATQTASVRLAVRFSRRDPGTGERIPYEAPLLTGVPILWATGHGDDFSDTWPLKRGDELWVQFAERSIDEWVLEGDEVTTPTSVRRFSLSDAVATPAKSSRGQPLPADATDDTARVIRAPELRLGSASASDYVALASLVKSELDAIWTALKTHIHQSTAPGTPTGPPTLPPPLPDDDPPWPSLPGGAGEVAATKVKAE